jgi:sec-independent protein translocase protein TatB
MFDITSSKLLILGIVALLVIGPKDLPALLRTLGKYMGIIKRHAAEFRAQFDEAMRESELEQLKKDVEGMGSEAEQAMREAEQSVNKELAAASQDVDGLVSSDTKPEPMTQDAGGQSGTSSVGAEATPPALNGASHPAEVAMEAPTGDTATSPGGSGGGAPAKADA